MEVSFCKNYFNRFKQILFVKREQKHFIGYWMTIIGFAFLVAGGIFSSYLELGADLGMLSAAAGFMVFLAGAELAHRNHEGQVSDSS